METYKQTRQKDEYQLIRKSLKMDFKDVKHAVKQLMFEYDTNTKNFMFVVTNFNLLSF